MRIYLVRHGESVTNRTGQFAGQIDVPLTELGERQAACVTNFFKTVPLTAVYSSDLSRAMNTVTGVAAYHGLTVTPEPQLREIFAGEWEGMVFEELPKRYPEAFGVWQNDIGNARCTGGETVAEAVHRADAALRRIAQKYPQGHVVAASHGGIVRGLLSLWKTGSTEAMQHLTWAPNASVSEIEWESGVFRVVREAVTEHLGDLVTELPKTV